MMINNVRNKEEIKFMINSLTRDIKNKEKMLNELKKLLKTK